MSGPIVTCDLCDANEDRLDDGRLFVVPGGYRSFGRRIAFGGPAMTLSVFEDNSLVRDAVESRGDGRVLVVDGQGSVAVALLGGNLAALAAGNGWAGVVVHGAVRDVAELDEADLGIRALALHPRRSRKAGKGTRDIDVMVSGVTVKPGWYVYADVDGILISTDALV